jgi:phosphoribosylformylglycinamidine synthase
MNTIPMTNSLGLGLESIKVALHDRMIECEYTEPLSSFEVNAVLGTGTSTGARRSMDDTSFMGVHEVKSVPLLECGQNALEEVSSRLSLGFDAHDIAYYSKLFRETLQRNPTEMECFDLGQSNSEHCRHWFFGGRLVIDGIELKESLFDMVKGTLPVTLPGGIGTSVISFHDNSSAIFGEPTYRLQVNLFFHFCEPLTGPNP